MSVPQTCRWRDVVGGIVAQEKQGEALNGGAGFGVGRLLPQRFQHADRSVWEEACKIGVGERVDDGGEPASFGHVLGLLRRTRGSARPENGRARHRMRRRTHRWPRAG